MRFVPIASLLGVTQGELAMGFIVTLLVCNAIDFATDRKLSRWYRTTRVHQAVYVIMLRLFGGKAKGG